ncbi:alpha/beta hydrolase [Blastococcus saxobsidens]|uniref:Alpha/beta hydrolase n=1 Tax=Blastococcus saxobsidens TaxID=138336 RepID=A0A6L9W4N6_9ACTN|nr:alpha/beta hydrolase [Blastococcus saxobsidens]NEK86739.1 alpha/beta hydrolase [Blastococcus saxobsidens]
MRRPLPRAALALGAAVAVALSGSSAAAAAPGGPAPGTPGYLVRDAQNIADAYGRQTAPDGQLSPAYGLASLTTINPLFARDLLAQAARPNRPALSPGQLVPGWNSGNPYRAGWDGTRGEITPVQFANRYGALIQGDVFSPLPGARDPYSGKPLEGPFPGVVLTTGSVQGSERMYWWLAQDLAERGYVVLTYDVQGQGRSETFPHQGDPADLPWCSFAAAPPAGEQTGCPGVPFQQTSNFVYGTQDAIDFFLSTPDEPYAGAPAGNAGVDAFNPLWASFDRSPDPGTVTPGRTTRLAVVGHSLGAIAVSYLQSVDERIQTVVALDKLSTTASIRDGEEFDALGPLEPVVPALGLQSEYGFTVAPYFANSGLFDASGAGSPTQAPDPRRELATGYDGWTAAGVDSMVVVPRASTHLEYTDVPYVLPASRYGQAVSSVYTQAWLAKYLRHDPSADDVLLGTSLEYLEPDATGTWRPISLDRDENLSFYFCSGYAVTTADGAVRDDDLAGVGC